MASSKRTPAGDGDAHTPSRKDEAEFREVIERANEVEVAKDDSTAALGGDFDGQVPGVKFLASFLKATIFTDLFSYHADLTYAHPTRPERIQALKRDAPVFHKFCRNADFAVRAGMIVITVLVVGGAALGAVVQVFWR